MERSRAILRQELRVLGSDPFPLFLLILTPLLMLAFMARAFLGAELQAVPGLTVLFGLFGISVVGHTIFRDHGWRTWGRLRASASPAELLIGKVTPLALLFFAQQVIVIYTSKIFGLDIRASVPQLLLVFVVITLFEVSLGLVVVSLCKSIQQVSAIATVGALLLGGVGGALAPISALPGWAQAVSRVSPAYWATHSLRSALVGDPFADRAPLLLALVAASFALCAIALALFEADDHKVFYG